MSFATVNSISLSARQGTVKLEELYFGQGGSVRSGGLTLSGTPVMARDEPVRKWMGETHPIARAEVDAWRSLIRGVGHVFHFDGCFSSDTNLQPDVGQTSKYTLSPTGGTGSTGYVTIASGQIVYIRAQLESGNFTVMYRYRNNGDPTWKRAAWSTGGLKYEDGSPVTYTNWTVYTQSGSIGVDVTVQGIQTGPSYVADVMDIDEIVLLPFEAPASWLATWTADTALFTALPVLSLGGDIIREGSIPVFGDVTAVNAVMSEGTNKFVLRWEFIEDTQDLTRAVLAAGGGGGAGAFSSAFSSAFNV